MAHLRQLQFYKTTWQDTWRMTYGGHDRERSKGSRRPTGIFLASPFIAAYPRAEQRLP